MSTSRMIGRGVAWNTVGTILGKIIVFGNIFLILHQLSVYEYGLSELIFSVISTMSIVLLPGLDSAITSDLAVERARGELGRMKAIFLRYFSVSFVLSTIAWAILFFGSSIAAHMAGNDSIEYFLKIVSFSFFLSPLRGMAQMMAVIEARFFDQSFYNVVEEVAKCLFLLLFFFGFHYGINGLLLAIVFSQLLTFFIYIPRTLSAYRYFGHVQADDGQVFWQILRKHRKWSVALSYMNNLSKTMQLWIIRLLLGTEAVGLYAFTTGVVGQIVSFLPFSSIMISIFPRFVDNRNELIRIFKSSIKAQFIVSTILLVCGYIGAPILFWIFPKYNQASSLVYIVLLSVIPSGVVGIFTPMFHTLKGQFAYFVSMIWKFAFASIFLVIGIMCFGIPGIGIAVVLGLTASAIERTIRLRSLIPGFTFSSSELFSLDETEISLLKRSFMEIRTKGIFSIFR